MDSLGEAAPVRALASAKRGALLPLIQEGRGDIWRYRDISIRRGNETTHQQVLTFLARRVLGKEARMSLDTAWTAHDGDAIPLLHSLANSY